MKESYAVIKVTLGKSYSNVNFDTESSARSYMAEKENIYVKRGYTVSGPPYRRIFEKGRSRIVLKLIKVTFVE